MIEAVKHYLIDLQMRLCETLEQTDAQAHFVTDQWERPEGGGGISRALSEGLIFERAGVNFSQVQGQNLPPSATAHRPELAGRHYQALGVSLVIHPHNPFVPTTHANVRFFHAEKPGQKPVWWFGGGFDLTPYYGFAADCQHWHGVAEKTCLPYGQDIYPEFKAWCDRYFYLPHRHEARGIGGIFFDDLNRWDFDTCFAFMRSVGDAFLEAYMPLVERRKSHVYDEHHRAFQAHRRGRYVEFNLVYDRGTLFGLQSGGRTESILMSMPPIVRWGYDWKPKEDSEEARLTEHFLKPQDWLVKH